MRSAPRPSAADCGMPAPGPSGSEASGPDSPAAAAPNPLPATAAATDAVAGTGSATASETAPTTGIAAAATPAPGLRLYSRQGCCLCEGLQERLEALALPLTLEVVDVDGDPALQARYGLRVPVLATVTPPPVAVQVAGARPPATPPDPAAPWRDLPPVPPRLAGERLQAWLAGQGLGLAGRGAVAGAAAPAGSPPADHP